MNCISPQQTFGDTIDLETLQPAIDNRLFAREPVYEGIPPGILRRMGRAVRMGVGCALPLVKDQRLDGIIIGTANGGMEDCIKFLNQIMDYEEGMLTPGNFVQSTANATAAQIGLMTANHNYNTTHVHRGLAFENALLDAMMLLKENPQQMFLLEGLDEISNYNYNIDLLDGWYKQEAIRNTELYTQNTPGTMAGEGAAAFIVSGVPTNAIAEITAVGTIHTTDIDLLTEYLTRFLAENNIPVNAIDTLISGENGDRRLQPYFDTIASSFEDATIVRYKHLFGEFGTSAALALWLACMHNTFPSHSIKKVSGRKPETILIYNGYKKRQHSFMVARRLK